MIKDRRVVLRMNLSQFSREIKQDVLVKMCTFVFISLKHSSAAFFLKPRLRYSSFVSVFLGFHCSDNGFDQGRARGSGITDGGGGGGGGSVTGNFVKDTGSGNG